MLDTLMAKVAAGAVVAALAVTILWQMERVKSARMEAQRDQARANVMTLKGAVAQQKNTIGGLLELAKQNQENVNEYFKNNEAANGRLLAAQSEISGLRATEERKALEAPFARGNAATLRINRSLCIIAGKGVRCYDQNDPGGQ